MAFKHQKSHTDMLLRFPDILQYLTVPPIFSECVYVLNES